MPRDRHTIFSRVSVPNSVGLAVPDTEDSPAQRGHSPLPAESTEFEIDVPSTSASTTAQPATLPELVPTHYINRYDRGIKIPKQAPGYSCIIEPRTLRFPRSGIPEGWIACSHPEGALYFYHAEGRVYTEANITKSDVLSQVNGCVMRLRSILQSTADTFRLPVDASLVLDPPPSWDPEGVWSYYYADHINRTLFWLEEYEFDVGELDGVPNFSQLQHEIEAKYWTHVEYFPHAQHTTQGHADEIMGILSFAMVDQQTSPSSTVLFSVDDLQKMFSCAKSAKKRTPSDHATAVIARLHTMFAHPRFLNYHGEVGARLERDQSVHGTGKYPRSTLIRVLAPALFNAPYVHLHALERIWVDRTMCHLPWGLFIEKLKSEWQEFTLFATVLLNANVAFLAIPSVDSGLDTRSPPQIISYVSIVCGIGCIIIGLLLVRQYRVKPRDTVEEATKFLFARTHPTRGVETLAILYSLPYALLMWSMLAFLAAFSYECFVAKDHAAVWSAGAAWIVVGLLIAWCIYSAWESQDEAWYRKAAAAYGEKVASLQESLGTVIHSHFSCLFPVSLSAQPHESAA
ncbi:hypothetical protein EIP91_010953 [Steccherinum ochraceum]|uniref:WW domain-containing protein n=1 Tax=Steccherinum ochraceum TaxID=92696 RepID=A0A4R0RBV7_9APHY|nr:hypothetical protein EIP91_010953 [Steccherinum ochraceum]